MKALLVNREWNIDGHWYAPSEHLESYKSVKRVELVDTTSSAGDWNGFFIQELNGRCYCIPFWQENNYPSSGFTLYTENWFVVFESENYPDFIKDACDMYIERFYS